MTDLYVDLPALQALADGLAAIHRGLAGAEGDLCRTSAATGSDEVAVHLDRFCSGWKDGRRSIMTELASLVGAIKGACDAYDRSERAVRTNCHPG